MEVDTLDFELQEDRKKLFDLMQQFLMRSNFLALKRLSNELLEVGSLKRNKHIIYLSLIPYVLYKVLSQQHIVRDRKWLMNKKIILDELERIEGKEVSDYTYLVKDFKNIFREQDEELYRYIRNISSKGKTKNAARLHSLGISLKIAVESTDADIIEVKHYLQHNRDHDIIKFDENISEKVKILEDKKVARIVFDSSTLISMGNSCLNGMLVKLKGKYPNTVFEIPRGVEEEAIDIGDRVMKFAWNAARIKRLTQNGVINVGKMKDPNLYREIERNVNGIFHSVHGNIEILQKGEIEALVLCLENEGVLAVDEITTRLLIETPKDLKSLIERRYKAKIMVDEEKLKRYNELIKGVKVVRSVDLVAYCFNEGLFKEYEKQDILKPLLFSLKYNGCATTFEEIKAYLVKRNQ